MHTPSSFQNLTNKHGHHATPSYITFNNKDCLVGEDAIAKAGVDHSNSIFNIMLVVPSHVNITMRTNLGVSQERDGPQIF